MSKSRPNIVVIMSDQHSPDVIGAAGDPRVHTPHLDRLAAEGTRFDQAYCNNPMCVPSRHSFLSGMTTQQLGVWSLSDTMRSDQPTWPVALGAAGYETVISGRMHCWWPDKLLGFQRRLTGDTDTRVAMGTYALYEPGAEQEDRSEWLREHWLSAFRTGQHGEGPSRWEAEDREATDHAVSFIAGKHADEGPWALCMGTICPHSPLIFPGEYYQRYAEMPVELEELDPTLPPLLQDFARLTGADMPIGEEARRESVRAYYAMVTYVDAQVGRVLAALEEAGQLENTWVIYTSDHGEMLGRRGLWYKNQLLEPSVRVPLLVRPPAGDGVRGASSKQVVSLLDIYPTLCDIAGAEAWEEIAGDSLLGVLRGEAAPELADRGVFIEYADYGAAQPSACIRRRTYKLIAARGYQSVLYDLAKDPGETTNCYRDPAYSEIVQELEADLAKHWEAEDAYQQVTRNQRRTGFSRRSLAAAAARAGKEL